MLGAEAAATIRSWPSWDQVDAFVARELAEKNLYWLAKEVLGYRELYPELHGLVCEFLQDFAVGEKEVGNLELARGHFKTTLADVSFSIQILLRNRDEQILLSHGKRDTAVMILREIKFHMEQNERLKVIAPDVFYTEPARESPMWLQDRVKVKRTHGVNEKVPSILATGTDASVVGMHFDWLVHDDLVFKENVGSVDMREKTREYRRESFPLLNKPRGRRKMLNIGTRWHFDDAHQELEDGAKGEGPYGDQVHQLKLGCRDADGEPLLPTIWTNDRLERTRRMMGSHAFSCQFENSPLPDGEEFFKRTDIRWFSELPGYKKIADRDGYAGKPYLFFTAVDPNRTEKTMADPCVVMTAARDSDGHVWVVDISRGHPTGTELVKLIAAHLERWDPEKVIVEANNYQYQLQRWLQEDQLRRGRAWPIQPVVRSGQTRKVERIGALQPLVERGALHLREGMEVVAQELEHWPAWKNDDTLDTLADIWTYGSNPVPKEGVAPPTNLPTMESLLEETRTRTSRPAARFGRGQPRGAGMGWLHR